MGRRLRRGVVLARSRAGGHGTRRLVMLSSCFFHSQCCLRTVSNPARCCVIHSRRIRRRASGPVACATPSCRPVSNDSADPPHQRDSKTCLLLLARSPARSSSRAGAAEGLLFIDNRSPRRMTCDHRKIAEGSHSGSSSGNCKAESVMAPKP